jgi:branched-chain amino acid transport system permease protein
LANVREIVHEQSGRKACFLATALAGPVVAHHRGLLVALPFVAALAGQAWVRIANFAILYIFLALGLNIVVGYAGLLDLGYVAFYAVGAYAYALLASPHFGLHLPFWVILPIGAAVACLFGVLLGAPTLKLRGDYLAIVTLGIRRDHPHLHEQSQRADQCHQWCAGDHPDRPDPDRRFFVCRDQTILGVHLRAAEVLLPARCAGDPGDSSSTSACRIRAFGRAWQAIREDEVAAKACGINTRNIKLLAFAMGASFGGVAGGVFAAMQGFVSPESFSLMESITILAMVVLGGMGHIPGVILGAILLTGLPEALRYGIEPLQRAVFGRMIIDPESLRMLIFGLRWCSSCASGRPACGLRRCAVANLPRSTIDHERTPDSSRSARSVAKHFGGVKALHDVSLTIRRGEIYGLIGPNGAGKTTFFNCLTGLYKNESGHFVFDGTRWPPTRRTRRPKSALPAPFRTFACSAT